MFLETDTLSEALSFARLRELPKKLNPELGLTWILAIALIKKKNLMNAYAIVEQRADGLIEYKKTFGRLSPIDGLISIHPYMYVDEEALGMATKANQAMRMKSLIRTMRSSRCTSYSTLWICRS